MFPVSLSGGLDGLSGKQVQERRNGTMGSIRRIERKDGAVKWQISFWGPPTEAEQEEIERRFLQTGKRPLMNSKGEIRKRPCYDTKKQAEAELGKRVSLLAEGKYLIEVGKSFKTTLGELVEKYTEAFAHQVSFSTAKVYYLKRFLEYWGKDTRLSFIGYEELEKFRNKLKATPTQHKKTRTVRAVNVEMACLRHMFKKAKEWGLMEKDPFHDGESLKLKGENMRKRFLEEKEIPALLLAAPSHLQPIIEAAIHLGTRAGKEILGIRWRDVDFEKGIVRINRSKQKGGAVKVDEIPLNDDCAALFRGLRQGIPDREAHVFTYKGKPIRSVARAFSGACKAANIKDFRFHDLRHTCASHMVMRGANPKEVQEHLGHANLSTTSRYLHLDDEARRKAANYTQGLTNIEKSGKRQVAG